MVPHPSVHAVLVAFTVGVVVAGTVSNDLGITGGGVICPVNLSGPGAHPLTCPPQSECCRESNSPPVCATGAKCTVCAECCHDELKVGGVGGTLLALMPGCSAEWGFAAASIISKRLSFVLIF